MAGAAAAHGLKKMNLSGKNLNFIKNLALKDCENSIPWLLNAHSITHTRNLSSKCLFRHAQKKKIPFKTQIATFQTSSALSRKDYYSILGVKKGTSASDIKKAYYKLAKQYHPDTNKNAGAEQKFQEIQQAYEVLSDDKKRAAYDQFGQTDFSGAGGGGGGGHGDPFGAGGPFQGNINMDDVFKQFFGERAGGFSQYGGSGFEQATRAQNVVMNLSFMESVHGGNKDLRIQTQEVCGRCSGKRAEPGTTLQTCPTCRGSGEETVSTGFFNMRSTCRRCQGQGTIIQTPCRKCRGKGSVMENKTVSIPVPAGIEDGQTVRVPISYGELFVTFKVAQSNIFKRDGFDVASDISISFAQAILGGKTKSRGLDGEMEINIPPGAQSHQQMRLTGKGIQRLNGFGKGDHYLNIKIHLPKYITEDQKELLLKFAMEDDTIRGTVNGLEEAKMRQQAADTEDNEPEDTSSEQQENPHDDRFYAGNSREEQQKQHYSEEKEFKKKFMLNMTREEARLFLSVSSVVFVVSLAMLLKSSS
ncbi:dnaJ homolog subfamily A member 3, mitochondrial-like isoform X2 [Clytia hemisphaerica]|uniref:dnaJ homolog subfamily A member 3, mitochondrial-like isoform X2 n=1 Tax=Clytia hemisphaerica TaxID=252671 RepID=UPI0034D66C9C